MLVAKRKKAFIELTFYIILKLSEYDFAPIQIL